MNNKLLVIGGPTGIGKSIVAYNIALKIKGEIVSADSMQFYKEINIGTDKIPLWMREKVPHHLIDFLSLRDEFDVYQFIKLSTKTIKEILNRGNLPIVVGGSGLYLRSLLKGIFDFPEEVKPKLKEIRNILEKESTDTLYTNLQKFDPVVAKTLHPNDRKRIRRALEVYLLTGKSITLWQKEISSPVADMDVTYYILTRTKNEMYNRIEQRVEQMFKNGWIEEVRNLKEQGYEQYLRLKAPIGYKEILDYLDGKYTLEELKTEIKKKTKNLAKRQLTWFKKEEGIWITLKDEGENATISLIMEHLKKGEYDDTEIYQKGNGRDME